MIGIIGAMDNEINIIIKNLKETKKKQVLFLEFYIGYLFNRKIVVVKSNEGKVNSAVATQIMIENFELDYILNVGVAGSLVDNLKVYDVAIARSVVEFDNDTTALGYNKGYIFGLNTVYLDTDDKLFNKIKSCVTKLNFNFLAGVIASSDKFITNTKEKEYINDTFNAIAVDMESASIAHVAKLNSKPFIAFRVISDSGSDIEYEKFAGIATEKIFEVLKIFLNS